MNVERLYMNTCPVCTYNDEDVALLNIYNVTMTICNECGSIHIQDTGQIIRMQQHNFIVKTNPFTLPGFVAVAWAVGEVNNVWLYIKQELDNK